MKWKALLPYAGLMFMALAVGVLASYLTFGSRPVERPRTDALLLHEARPLPDFSLTDTGGTAFTRTQLMGHWSLLYFGYTHCPDACPTTLAALDRMMRLLDKLPAARRPHVYFISVDPQRDDPKLLKTYAAYFNPGFTGLTASVPNLKALTGPLGADFSYGRPDKKGDYAVVHSTMVVLVDPEAAEMALFTPPLDPKRMAADYANIIRYYGEQQS
ncbi:MAG TPA: SCO family protein [Gammaproteobacteria bacterium]|nr:SCO family protein [Gammaproteobacteria bacterium]